MAGNKKNKNKGFTLVEAIVTLTILGILLTIAGLGLSAYLRHSAFVRNNNYAQTIYYAASSSLNHYKSTGQLKELQEYMTQGAGKNQTVDSSMVEDMPEEYDGRLYYLTLVPGSADTERLYELLEPYIYDESVLDAAITVEFDPAEGLVYSVCYSDYADSFYYQKGERTKEDRGSVNISSRTRSIRKERMIGYYSSDEMSEQSPGALGKPELQEVELVNDEELTLNWYLKKEYSALTQYLNYSIKLYDKESKKLQATLEVNTEDKNKILKKGSDLGNKIFCDVTLYSYGADGKEESHTVMKDCPFYAYGEGSRLTLVLDAVDLGAVEKTSVDEMKDTLSVIRLGLQEKTIYARVKAFAKNYKASAWKQSNSSCTTFGSAVQNGNQTVYGVKNARHLYNIRFSEKEREALAGKKKDTSKIIYSQTGNIRWSRENSILSREHVYQNGAVLTSEQDINNTAFPPIRKLTESSAYTGKSGNTKYTIENLILKADSPKVEEGDKTPQVIEPLGLFAVNEGTIQGAALLEVTAEGDSCVGALCGNDKGSISDCTVSGSVTGTTDVGGLVGIQTGERDAVYKNLTNQAHVSGKLRVGGIIGSIGRTAGEDEKEKTGDTLENCRNYGGITASEASGKYIGGITGYSDGGILKDCVSTPSVSVNYEEEKPADLFGDFVGGIVGYSKDSAISGCKTSSRDIHNKITDAYVVGKRFVGGIAGFTEDSILDGSLQANQANILGESYVGGIVGANGILDAETGTVSKDGKNEKTVENWTNEGIVVATAAFGGGIAGYNGGRILGCTSSVNTLSQDGEELLARTEKLGKNGDYIGGIAGYNEGTIRSKDGTRVTSVVAGHNYVGGIAGYNRAGDTGENASIRGYTLAGGYISGSCFVGGYVGLNTGTDIFTEGSRRIDSNPNAVEGSYFVGGVFGGNIIAVYEEKRIPINCGTDNFLGSIRAEAGAFAGGYAGYTQLVATGEEAEKTAALYCTIADRHAGDVPGMTGEVLANELSAASTTDAVLEMYNEEDGRGGNQNTLKSVEAELYAGGVVGYNAGNTSLLLKGIQNNTPVYAYSDTENQELSYTETFSYAGGVIGIASERVTIDDCRNTDKGIVRGQGTYTGGIVEVNQGTIQNCTVGSMTGESFLGGIAGLNKGGRIENCTLTGQMRGDSYLGGIVCRNEGEIVSCRVLPDDAQVSSVMGDGSYIGGISAVNSGDKASITGWEIKGDIEGAGSFVGGIAGSNENAAVIGLEKKQEAAQSGTITGGEHAGGIAGVNGGDIYASGELLENTFTVRALEGNAGGIAGLQRETGNISGTGNTGSIIAEKGNAGGIVCDNRGRVEASENSGEVTAANGEAGGICGENSGTVTGCRTLGGTLSGQGALGGIAAANYGRIEDSSLLSKAELAIMGGQPENYIGGIAGRNTGVIVTSKVGSKTAPVRLSSDEDNSNVGGVAGYNGPEGRVDGMKAPETVCYADIILEGKAQGNLGGIAGVNEGTISYYGAAGRIQGSQAQGQPYGIGGIAGVNGNGTNTAVIRNCTYQGESLKGGKGSIHGNGISTTSEDLARVGGITGQNLLRGEIRQCTIGGGSSITGSLSYLGGLAGYNQGLIQDCIEQTESVVVQGIKSSCVGGAVGYNGDEGRTANVSVGIADSTQESKNWSIVNSQNTAHEFGTGGIIGNNVSRCDQSGLTNHASVKTDQYYVGGIIGIQANRISQGTLISDCRNTGSVYTSRYGAGGIIGFLRDYGVTVRGCVNQGKVTADCSRDTAYRARAAGILGDAWTNTADMQITIMNCGNEGIIDTGMSGSPYAAGIFSYVNAVSASQVTLSDCYNAGVVKNSTDGGGIVSNLNGNMSVTLIRCVNYGSGLNPSGDFSGITGRTKAVMEHCFGVGKADYPLARTNKSMGSLNYYFGYGNVSSASGGKRLAYPSGWDSSGWGSLSNANKKLNGFDLTFSSNPAAGKIYDNASTAQQLQTAANKIKDICKAPIEKYFAQYYGAVTLGEPQNFGAKANGDTYTASWSRGTNGDRVYYYELKLYRAGETEPVKVVQVPKNQFSAEFSIDSAWPDGTAFWITLQAVSGNSSRSSSILKTETFYTAESLPEPELVYYITGGSSSQIQGYFSVANLEEYKKLTNDSWQIHITTDATGEMILGQSNEGRVSHTFNSGKRNLSTVCWAEDSTGTYRTSAVVSQLSYLRSPKQLPRVARTIYSSSLSGTSVSDMKYQFEVRNNNKGDSFGIDYRAEMLHGDEILAETSAKIQKEGAQTTVSLDFAALSEEEFEKLTRVEAAGETITIRYFAWTSGIGTYYQNVENSDARANGSYLNGDRYYSVSLAQGPYAGEDRFTFVMPPRLDLVSISDTMGYEETGGKDRYTFSWNSKAPWLYDVQLIGYKSETDTEGVEIISRKGMTDTTLTVDGTSWSYSRVRLYVTHRGVSGESIDSRQSRDYRITRRLSPVSQPKAVLPSRDNLIYQVTWNPLTDEEQLKCLDSYLLTASAGAKTVTASAGKEDTSFLLNLEEFNAHDRISITVTAVSADTSRYLNSRASVPVTVELPQRLTKPDPDTTGFQITLDPDYQAEYGGGLTEEEFRLNGLTLSAAAETTEEGAYAGEAYITETAEVEETPLYQLNSYTMNGSLKSADYNFLGVPTEYAGKYLHIRVRAVSNNIVSSQWSQWYTFRLPKVKIATPDLSQTDSREIIWKEKTNNGVTTGESSIKAVHTALAWNGVTYGSGYQLTWVPLDTGADTAYTVYLHSTEDPGEPFELWMRPEDMDPEFQEVIQDAGPAGTGENRYVKLPSTVSQETGRTRYTFQIPHSYQVSGRDSAAGYQYQLYVNPQIQCTVTDAGDVSFVYIAPDMTVHNQEYHMTASAVLRAYSWEKSEYREASYPVSWQLNRITAYGEYIYEIQETLDTAESAGQIGLLPERAEIRDFLTQELFDDIMDRKLKELLSADLLRGAAEKSGDGVENDKE